MKILITGIQGFVGSNFSDAWKDKYMLYGLDINRAAKDGVQKIYGWDEFEQLPQVETIIHLAGKAQDTKKQNLAKTYLDVNTTLTQKIFDFFLESDIQTFIFFSSIKAVTDNTTDEIVTEDRQPKPRGPYGESKRAAEEYIIAQSKKATAKNKRVFILRPSMIHGPGNTGNLNLLFRLISKGVPWPLGAYENRRSFCSIENATFVVDKLMTDLHISGDIYHLADDEALSTNDIIKLICEQTKKKASIWHIPKTYMNAIATIGEKLHLPLNRFLLEKLTGNYIVSNAKIKRTLSIDNMPVSATEGLRKTIQSFHK